MHVVTCDGGFHLLFQASLHRGIQGENHAVALAGSDVIFIGKGHIHFIIALGGNHLAGAAGQICIISSLHPFGAIVGSVGKADDLGCQGAKRVCSLGGRFQMDAGNVLLLDIVPDFRGSLLIHPGTDLLIALLDIPGLFFNPSRVLVQNLPQGLGQGRNIGFGLLQLMGVQVDVFHADRGGQNVHVPVQNVPPVGRYRCGSGLVSQSKARVIFVLVNHQCIQPPGHRYKGQNSQHQHHQQDSLVLTAVQAQPVVFLPTHTRPLLKTNP